MNGRYKNLKKNIEINIERKNPIGRPEERNLS
jgi:hypothetical protein